jgi:PKD repeat protein
LTVLATATPSGGTEPYTYQWSSAPGGLIGAPTAASTNVTFAVVGTYTVTCTVTDSANQTASDSVEIVVSTTPAITGDAAAGQALFTSKGCSGCHPGIGPALTAASAAKVSTNLGASAGGIHAAITLTAQEVADIQAFLATR